LLGVAVSFLAHGHDAALVAHDGVGLQEGAVDVARQQQADVADDNLAGGGGGGGFGHGGLLGNGDEKWRC